MSEGITNWPQAFAAVGVAASMAAMVWAAVWHMVEDGRQSRKMVERICQPTPLYKTETKRSE